MQMQVQRLELDGYLGTLAASISPSQGRGPVSQWPHPQVPEPHDALASPQVADAGNTQQETSVCGTFCQTAARHAVARSAYRNQTVGVRSPCTDTCCWRLLCTLSTM